MMNELDQRIGKPGARPLLTVRGLPVNHRKITETRNLGHGYYCVVDVVRAKDTNKIVAKLKAIVEKMNEPKRKNRKTGQESGNESDTV